MLLPLVLLALGLAPHPGSLSRSVVVVRDDAVAIELRTQMLTWHETLSIDTDGDGELTLAELEGKRTELALYLDERLDVLVPADDGEHVTAMHVGRIEAIEPGDGPLDPLAWVRVELVYDLGLPRSDRGRPDAITIVSRLFLESNPDHIDYCSVEWVGEAPSKAVFGNGLERETFRRQGERRAGVFREFVTLGVDHILSGWDHLAFVLALIVAARRVRSLLGVVTAFTAAHSITLALAALDVVRLPGRFVELAIALSIAYVAVDNLLRREAHAAWLEAFGFGLIHGLGFAGFLADALAGEPLVVTALVGFNLGVELGQVGVVIVVAGALLVLQRFGRRPDEDEPAWLAPRWLRASLNVAIALAGLYWFGERAGWIG